MYGKPVQGVDSISDFGGPHVKRRCTSRVDVLAMGDDDHRQLLSLLKQPGGLLARRSDDLGIWVCRTLTSAE
jgi:hypothetical protein